MKQRWFRGQPLEGGLHLSCTLGVPRESIRGLLCPGRLVVPLNEMASAQGAQPHDVTCALQNTPVRRGQTLCAPESGVLAVHAPRAGRAQTVRPVLTAEGCWCDGLTILPETEAPLEPEAPCVNPSPASSEAGRPASVGPIQTLAGTADQAGIPGLYGASLGCGEQLRRAAESGISDVIVCGLATEPILAAPQALLAIHTRDILSIARRLQIALEADRLWLALDRAQPGLVRQCQHEADAHEVRVAVLDNRYPQAHPVLLAYALTGRETPPGKTIEQIHVLVLEVRQLVWLAQAVGEGAPVTDTVITVAGPAIRRPGYYRVPIGTHVADVLAHAELSPKATGLVAGGLLTGIGLRDTASVITKHTRALLALDDPHTRCPDPGPCIRCGFCHTACPVGLDPAALLDAWERRGFRYLQNLHPRACLACGLCSYVCPTQLPLSAAAVGVKGEVERAGAGAPQVQCATRSATVGPERV